MPCSRASLGSRPTRAAWSIWSPSRRAGSSRRSRSSCSTALGAALDEAVDRGVLVLSGSRVSFRHELARLAIEGAVAAGRRRELHVRLLEVLEARSVADPARLAHHAEAAGDAERVLRYAPAAAREASARGSHREAARQLERAVAHADGLPPAELADLLVPLGGGATRLRRAGRPGGAAGADRRAAPAVRRRSRAGVDADAPRADLLGDGPHPRRLRVRRRSGRDPRAARRRTGARARVRGLQPPGDDGAPRQRGRSLGTSGRSSSPSASARRRRS